MVAARLCESLTSALPGVSQMVDPVFKLVHVSCVAAAAAGAAAIATATAHVTSAGAMHFSLIRMVWHFPRSERLSSAQVGAAVNFMSLPLAPAFASPAAGTCPYLSAPSEAARPLNGSVTSSAYLCGRVDQSRCTSGTSAASFSTAEKNPAARLRRCKLQRPVSFALRSPELRKLLQ
jgi:hypothetical protein